MADQAHRARFWLRPFTHRSPRQRSGSTKVSRRKHLAPGPYDQMTSFSCYNIRTGALVPRNRESVSRVAVSIALIAAVLGVVILGTGGFGTTVMGRRVSAHNPLRAATVAAAIFLLAISVVGRRRAPESRTTIWLRGPGFFDPCNHRCRCRNASSIDMGLRSRSRPLAVSPRSR